MGMTDQDVEITGEPRYMESDTTVPGDKLHDPVETPAGKRKSTPVINVAIITVTEQ